MSSDTQVEHEPKRMILPLSVSRGGVLWETGCLWPQQGPLQAKLATLAWAAEYLQGIVAQVPQNDEAKKSHEQARQRLAEANAEIQKTEKEIGDDPTALQTRFVTVSGIFELSGDNTGPGLYSPRTTRILGAPFGPWAQRGVYMSADLRPDGTIIERIWNQDAWSEMMAELSSIALPQDGAAVDSTPDEPEAQGIDADKMVEILEAFDAAEQALGGVEARTNHSVVLDILGVLRAKVSTAIGVPEEEEQEEEQEDEDGTGNEEGTD